MQILLTFLSKIYEILLKVRELLFRKGILKAETVEIPVISVGNLSLGGTGKTSLVEKLSVYFKAKGLRPCIATRGYKRKKKGTFFVDVEKDKAKDVGDEPLLLAKRTGVLVVVSKNRAEGIRKAIKERGVEIAILDDGFQLKNIKKDVEILILHRTNHGAYELFPKGYLREKKERIRDGDIILFKGDNIPEFLMPYLEKRPVFKISYKPLYLFNLRGKFYLHYNFLKGKRILAFSGLGDNNTFFELLEEIGSKIIHAFSFPDHYSYREKDMKMFKAFNDIELIVTTEKDAVKLSDFDLPYNLFSFSVEAKIDREREFFDLIEKLLKERKCQEGSISSIQP